MTTIVEDLIAQLNQLKEQADKKKQAEREAVITYFVDKLEKIDASKQNDSAEISKIINGSQILDDRLDKEIKKYLQDEVNKRIEKLKSYHAEVMVWGAEYGASDFGPQAKALYKGLDVGHAAIKVSFPIDDENQKLVKKMETAYGEDFSKMVTENKENGTYELYWSFWPGEEKGEPHKLATLQEDIYWQRFGVPVSYNTKTEAGRGLENEASARSAKGLFGQRMPYKLGPEVTTHYPQGVKIDGSSDFQKQIPNRFKGEPNANKNAVIDDVTKDKENFEKLIEKKVKSYQSNNAEYVKIIGEYNNLFIKGTTRNSTEETKFQDLKKLVDGRNQDLADLLYAHNNMVNGARKIENESFKLSRDPKINKQETTKDQIVLNKQCMEMGTVLVGQIEKAIPQELANHVTHGLLPQRIPIPLVKDQDKPGLHLESLLNNCGKLSQQKVRYEKLGRWNCYSTTAHIVHQSLSNSVDDKTKAQLSPNRLLPYTPQQIFNKIATFQHSTLHGERSNSFISMMLELANKLKKGFDIIPEKIAKERKHITDLLKKSQDITIIPSHNKPSAK